MLKNILSLAYRWQKTELAIRMWIKVDCCVPIMSYDDTVHYITYKWWLRPPCLLDRTNIIPISMTTSVSRSLYLLCIQFKVRMLFATMLLARNVWGLELYLHEIKTFMKGIISLKKEAFTHKTSSNPPLLLIFRSQSRKVREVSILRIFTMFFTEDNSRETG